MAKHVRKSSWREQIWDRHGLVVTDELRRTYVPNQRFRASDAVGRIRYMDHLSEATVRDVISAVCNQLAVKKVLLRQGNHYYFP